MIRIGCDIVEIEKITKLDESALKKIFHKRELMNKKPESLAGIFAAKESCKKVFNYLSWHDIEIKTEKNGKPILKLTKIKNITSCDISISHDGEYAFATAVFLLSEAR